VLEDEFFEIFVATAKVEKEKDDDDDDDGELCSKL